MADPSTAFLGRSELVTFAGFVVPGFIAMLSYSLMQPGSGVKLKEAFLEAIAFGIVNLVLLWPAVSYLANSAFSIQGWSQQVSVYVLGILVFLIAPVFWAFVLDQGLGWLERRDWILRRPKNGWDAFFLKKLPAKVIVRLKDGAMIGGQLGNKSYASLSPNSGHLYIERVWKITSEGVFLEPIAESLGVILRPGDYEFVELFVPNPMLYNATGQSGDS